MLQRLILTLDPNRFENEVICLGRDATLAFEIKQAGVTVHEIGMSNAFPSPASLWRLYHLFRTTSPDILQSWLYHSDLLGLLLGRLANIPRIVWNIRCADMGVMYETGRNAAVLQLLALLSRWPDAVITNSHAGKDRHAKAGYRPKAWEILPNGFDIALFRPRKDAGRELRRQLSLGDDSLLVGLVARFDPIKDHPTFLRAAAVCAQETDEAHFVLVGSCIDDRNEALRELIQQFDLSDRVHLLGERTDIPFLTSAFDIATCSSLGEGFPNVIGEAMACGIPVVATDVGDSARLLNGTGIVVPPANPEAFGVALFELLRSDAERRNALGEAGRRQIEQNYSIAQISTRYGDFYERLVAAPRGTPDEDEGV